MLEHLVTWLREVVLDARPSILQYTFHQLNYGFFRSTHVTKRPNHLPAQALMSALQMHDESILPLASPSRSSSHEGTLLLYYVSIFVCPVDVWGLGTAYKILATQWPAYIETIKQYNMRSWETFHIPRDDIQLPGVEARNEVGLLFVLNYLLELEGEPEWQFEYTFM